MSLIPNLVDDLAHYWVPLTYEEDGLKIRFEVSGQPMKQGGKFMMVSAREQQEIADELDASLLTPKLADLMHLKADVRVEPVIQVPPGSGKIAATADHGEWNRWTATRVGDAVGAWEDRIADELGMTYVAEYPLISGIGKDWVLSRKMTDGKAVNHGWYSKGALYASSVEPWHLKLWQNEGSRHDRDHRDPSQCARFVRQRIFVEEDGVEREEGFSIALRNTRWGRALCHDGPLDRVRVG